MRAPCQCHTRIFFWCAHDGVPSINGFRLIVDSSRAVGHQVSAQLLRTLLEGIANLDRKIEEAASAHADFFIVKSLPGAGSALAPRLLAALGSQRDRYGSAAEVQKHSGIAPVMEKSGRRSGFISAGPARSFCGKVFTNGRDTRSRGRSGHAPTTSNSEAEAKTTTRRCAPWLSNGFASYFNAGKIE